MTFRKLSLAVAFLIGWAVWAVVPALAQAPMQTRINFTTSAPFALKGTDVVLPEGTYVLLQIDQRDRQLFALYHEDMTNSPVAMIRTVRMIQHDLGQLPRKTRMIMDVDEGSPHNLAVLEGWSLPGDYGWEVISVTPSRGLLTSRLSVRR